MEKVTGVRSRVTSMPSFDGMTPSRPSPTKNPAGVHMSGPPSPSVMMKRPRPKKLGKMAGTHVSGMN